MYSLLVLGIIPGTNIQISFQAWLLCAVLLGVFLYRNFQRLRLALQVSASPQHQPIHARDIHLRGA